MTEQQGQQKAPDLSFLDAMEHLDDRDREIIRAYANGEEIPGDENGEIGMYLAAMAPDVSTQEGVEALMTAQGTTDDAGTGAEGTEGGQDPAGGTGGETGGSEAGEGGISQDVLNASIKKRAQRLVASELGVASYEEAKDLIEKQRNAETERLKEENRYKELYEAEVEKVKALQPKETDAERYKEVLDAQLESRKKDLKPHIVELLDKMDTADQLQYLTDHADELGRPEVRTDDTTEGTPPARQGETTARDRLEKRLPKLRR